MKCAAHKWGCGAEATFTCENAPPTCIKHKSSCCVPIEAPKFRTSCVRDGVPVELGPCLACDECRYWAPESCDP